MVAIIEVIAVMSILLTVREFGFPGHFVTYGFMNWTIFEGLSAVSFS